jgi:hypothetical protein
VTYNYGYAGGRTRWLAFWWGKGEEV